MGKNYHLIFFKNLSNEPKNMIDMSATAKKMCSCLVGTTLM